MLEQLKKKKAEEQLLKEGIEAAHADVNSGDTVTRSLGATTTHRGFYLFFC